MSDTPRTDKAFLESSEWDFPANHMRDKMQELERELNTETSQKMKYRERAWHAEAQLEIRYGLRKEINSELGLADETGDDALRKGLETIKSLKAQLVAMTKRADEMERLKEHNGEMFYRVERELNAKTMWHKISDGMPGKDVPVLIAAKQHRDGTHIVCSATWDGDFWFPHGASGCDCEPEFDCETITHWILLPDAPKSEEEKQHAP